MLFIIDNDIIGKNIVEIAAAELAKGPNDVGNNLDVYPFGLGRYIDPEEAWCSEFVSWVYKIANNPFDGGTFGGWMLDSHTKIKNW